MKVYDISVPMRMGMPVWPGDEQFMRSLTSSISEGDRANVSIIHCSSHTGTHVDAPFHFLQEGISLDMVDISRLVGTVQVLKMDCNDDITADDLEKARRDGRLSPETQRVLFKTKNSERRLMLDPEFHKDYAAVGASAAEWLVQNHFITVGVDYLSVERFHPETPQTHPILLGADIFVIEGLNMIEVPEGIYTLVCGALNIEGADGSPARVFLLPPFDRP
jgi:arylformamidase